MKKTTKLALIAGGGLVLLGGLAFAMSKPAAASTSGGGGTPPPGLPPVPGSISVASNAPYSLRIFNTSMGQVALTNALNGLGFTPGFTLSQNSDGTWDLGGTWTGASGSIQAQQNGFAFDPTF